MVKWDGKSQMSLRLILVPTIGRATDIQPLSRS
jgi:hypothetical protein